ncbi:alpha/beta hydrolase [Superficieibacter electus]|uniref:Alpha/beta hydrolase n=1 Tax=Superficieibacter electus TaxID=2022662 RepID=A0A2P5GRZ7_9ENTR|nr:alpha/beta hydrolase [Superficieibacter electus]POP46033.1 alpha/beta hydrolase [Superficieibacter electus]POP49340.1 alpha/beta hydrolase [Superficieibacter electus]
MKTFYSRIAGAKVRWQALPGEGHPVVFIHGLGCASSYEYPRVVMDAQFGRKAAILIDLPGSGYSERPQAFSYHTRDQARVVVELLESLNLQHFYLYGHSMGGSIAIEVATLMTDRLLALAVSEPNFSAGGGMFSRQIAAQAEEAFVHDGYAALLAAEDSPWAGSLQSNAPWAVWRGAKSLVDGITPSWLMLFRSLRCPHTLIVGELSEPDTDVETIRAWGIPVLTIEKAGHSMSWENPSALAGILASVFH